MRPCRPAPSATPIRLAALLLACQPCGAAAQEWDLAAAVASAQTERGLAYIDKPLGELSARWWGARGWSAGASAARALHASQATLAASAGHGWSLAPGVDAYVTLGHRDYRRQGDWRYRYSDARLTVNLHDRLFVSLTRLFDVRSRSPYGQVAQAGTLATEAVWRHSLPHALTLTAGLGHAAQRGPAHLSYWYGNLGLRATRGDTTFEAAWIGTDADARRWWGAQAGKRWVATVRWNL